LCNAIHEFLEDGPEAVWRQLGHVGRQTRQALADLPGWAVLPAPSDIAPDGPGSAQAAGSAQTAGSAITALRPVDGQSVKDTRNRLLSEHGIVTSACHPGRAPLEMTDWLLRVSPHVDCTPDDLARLRKALQPL
jgi:hercynylcysteine S-oxide lyase